MDHEQAGKLYEDHPTAWVTGVAAAAADLSKGRELIPAEAIAVAARHYAADNLGAAAYWGGYAAGIVLYERGEHIPAVLANEARRAQLTVIKHEEIADEVARGEHRFDEEPDDA